MVDKLVELPPGQETAALRVEAIFEAMDRNGDDRISLLEFREGAKADPSIVQALQLYQDLL